MTRCTTAGDTLLKSNAAADGNTGSTGTAVLPVQKLFLLKLASFVVARFSLVILAAMPQCDFDAYHWVLRKIVSFLISSAKISVWKFVLLC